MVSDFGVQCPGTLPSIPKVDYILLICPACQFYNNLLSHTIHWPANKSFTGNKISCYVKHELVYHGKQQPQHPLVISIRPLLLKCA